MLDEASQPVGPGRGETQRAGRVQIWAIPTNEELIVARLARAADSRRANAMLIAKVTGSLVATEKVGSMVGRKLLVVEPYRLDPQSRGSLVTTGRSMVAVNTVGAGEGEFVLLTQGQQRPADAGDEIPAGRYGHHRHHRHRTRRSCVRLRQRRNRLAAARRAARRF